MSEGNYAARTSSELVGEIGDSSMPSSRGVSSSSPCPGADSINFRISDWEIEREFSLLSSLELITGSSDLVGLCTKTADADACLVDDALCLIDDAVCLVDDGGGGVGDCDESTSKSTLSRMGFCLSLERQNRRDLVAFVLGVGREGDSHGELFGVLSASSFSDSGCSWELSKKDSVDLMRLFLRDKILFFQSMFFSLPLMSRVSSAGGVGVGGWLAATLFDFLLAVVGFVVGLEDVLEVLLLLLLVDGGGGVGDDDVDAGAGVNADSMRCCSSSNDLNGFLQKLADSR